MPCIEGMRCLDLFAGTGVLGIEALSRGASSAYFVDRDPAAVRQLEAVLRRLGCETGRVVLADACRFLRHAPEPFDLVFLDPPYEGTAWENLCTLLARGWLAPGACIYLEVSHRSGLPGLPSDWEVLRDKTAGQVRFALARSR
jgi:16S rRNA (guanine966-N2)-methyltransferase